jgi:hypothetical protein
MPPEQFSGNAGPASDLYALGASMVHLLTHVHPSKLPRERLKLRWRDRAGVSTPLGDFIDRLLEPVVEDRIITAEEALAGLDNLGGALMHHKQQLRGETDVRSLDFGRPSHADATIRWNGDTLMVDMSQSMVTPRLLAATAGLIVGLALMIILVDWTYLVLGPLIGLLVSEAWAAGPDETLQLFPGGRFLFVHRDGRNRRETSGNVQRLTLYGGQMHIQTDSGAIVAIGSHCSAPTRRWIFAKVDEYLRDKKPSHM